MNKDQFNNKYSPFLKEGFEGLEFEDPKVIEYLDKEFEDITKDNPDFQYMQIKIKFGHVSIYTNSSKDKYWENKLNN